MKNDFQIDWHLKKSPTGPLVKYLNQFLRYLVEQGYCRRYIGLQCRVVANFSKWLSKKNISEYKITEEHINQFFEGANYQPAISNGKVATLHRLIDFLKQLGIIQESNNSVIYTPLQKIINFEIKLFDLQAISGFRQP